MGGSDVHSRVFSFEEGLLTPVHGLAPSSVSPKCPERLEGLVRLRETFEQPEINDAGSAVSGSVRSSPPQRPVCPASDGHRERVKRLSERIRPAMGVSLEVGAMKQEK